MKPTDKQKAEVRKYLKKWQPKLFLHQWQFDISYHDDQEHNGAKINMQAEYKAALIEIHMDFFNFTKEKREEVILHELCHCIIQPIITLACSAADGFGVSQREIDWHKESVTQNIATALFY